MPSMPWAWIVVHDLGPHSAGPVELLIFRDFGGIIDQVQRKAEAAAHFDILHMTVGL